MKKTGDRTNRRLLDHVDDESSYVDFSRRQDAARREEHKHA